MNTEALKANWNMIKGRMKQQYGQLTDDDLAFGDGITDELLGRLQKKLGKTREAIREELQGMLETEPEKTGS